MRDTARNPVALDLLQVQRNRLADRMRPPWWYLPGCAVAWAVGFTGSSACDTFPALTTGPSGSPPWRCGACCSGD